MSVNFSMWIHIGYRIPIEAFGVICTVVPPKTHTETRYDPITGKEAQSAVIVDEEGEAYYEINGERTDVDCPYELEDLINKRLGTDIPEGISARLMGDTNLNDMWIVIGPRLKYGPDSLDLGNIDVGGSVDLNVIDKLKDKLAKIREALEELGIPIEADPAIHQCWSVN